MIKSARDDGITGEALLAFVNNERAIRPDGTRAPASSLTCAARLVICLELVYNCAREADRWAVAHQEGHAESVHRAGAVPGQIASATLVEDVARQHG